MDNMEGVDVSKAIYLGLAIVASQGLWTTGMVHAAEPTKGVQELLGELKSKVSPGLVDGSRPETVLEVAKGFGLADLDKTSDGTPMIEGRINGLKYGVHFYGCVENKSCTNIQLFSFFDGKGVSLASMNAWNADTRFGKAYIDRDGDAAIELNVNLDYGVSKKNLEDTFDWWMLVLGEFQKYLKNPEVKDKKPAVRSPTSL